MPLENKYQIVEKVIDEVSENPKDKSKLITKIGWSLVIFSVIFSGSFGVTLAILLKPIIEKLLNVN